MACTCIVQQVFYHGVQNTIPCSMTVHVQSFGISINTLIYLDIQFTSDGKCVNDVRRTLSADMMDTLELDEMWFYRCMVCILWKERIINEEVLRKVHLVKTMLKDRWNSLDMSWGKQNWSIL